MADPKWEFQKAIFNVLEPEHLGVTEIYDRAPQGVSEFPYVTIGESVATMQPVDEVMTFNLQMRIHTFSRSGTNYECFDIQACLFKFLHNAKFSVPGFNLISLLREDSFADRDQDGKTHGVCEYRALLQAT